MSYIVFARKYRPGDFDEIVGQGHITRTLKNAILQGRVAHAYIFSGPRGIGKTTTARILAKALNCEKGPAPKPCNECASCREITSGTGLDVIEIDGASNRGIDEIRELRENVKFAPSRGSYKLYIIDEVHMLTTEAFNALLKTLEEPPPHVKFIFATTHPDKVPATVLSRCQRLDFRRISVSDIKAKLREIANSESIDVSDETLFLIARQAEGSLRDAESILDQLNAFCNKKIEKEDIAYILGTVNEELLGELVRLVKDNDASGVLKFIDKLVREGKDLPFFLAGLIEHFRNLLVAKLSKEPQALIDLSPKSVEDIVAQAGGFSQEELFYIANVLANTHESIKRSASARLALELALVRIANRPSMASLAKLLDKLEDIENRMGQDSPAAAFGKNGWPKERPQAPPAEPDAQDGPSGGEEGAPDKAPGGENAVAANEPVAIALPADSSASAPQEPCTDISRIHEVWPSLLKLVRNKKISAASYLLEGRPVTLNEGTLTVALPRNYALHKEVLEKKEHRDLIEGSLKGILEKTVKIKFTIADNVPAEDTAGDYGRNGDYIKTPPVEADLLREPVVQSALEAFEGRVVRKIRK